MNISFYSVYAKLRNLFGFNASYLKWIIMKNFFNFFLVILIVFSVSCSKSEPPVQDNQPDVDLVGKWEITAQLQDPVMVVVFMCL